MRNDTIRLRLAQMEVQSGQPWRNAERMLDLVSSARRDGVRLLVFPEMAIPGYLIGDAWEREAFLHDCEACGQEIRRASEGLAVAFGNVAVDWKARNEDGRVRKYNALFVADGGAFLRPAAGPLPFVAKTLMANYREFDDSRHFFDLRKLALELQRPVADLIAPVVLRDGLSLGCMLCEDAWVTDYPFSPPAKLAAKGARLLINASCSPFTLSKNHKRNRVFAAHAAKLKCPLAYVNNVGIQNNGKTVFTFDGSSCVYDGADHAATLPALFAEDTLTLDLPLDGRPFGETVPLREDGVAETAAALAYGTRKFMEQCGVSRVVVGVSGGIDSAVVAALYRHLLPPDRLLLVNMPSRHNSPTTRLLAQELAANLGALYAVVPIEDAVNLTRDQIRRLPVANVAGDLKSDLTLSDFMLENVQARDRSGRVLAALASAFGGVFTCNANKSEVAVGYTTFYGDLAGYLANIADLWKGEVYELARHLNERVFGRPVIPQGVFGVTPSAELGPHQNVDEGKGDPLLYPYHDRLFQSWVEWWNRATPEEALRWYAEGCLEERVGYDGKVAALFPDASAFVSDLERWWNQYQGMAVAKRIQAPPILAVKRRAFGFDHREAQMPPAYTRRYHEMKARLLSPAP